MYDTEIIYCSFKSAKACNCTVATLGLFLLTQLQLSNICAQRWWLDESSLALTAWWCCWYCAGFLNNNCTFFILFLLLFAALEWHQWTSQWWRTSSSPLSKQRPLSLPAHRYTCAPSARATLWTVGDTSYADTYNYRCEFQSFCLIVWKGPKENKRSVQSNSQ
jgi:hypothetical protein